MVTLRKRARTLETPASPKQIKTLTSKTEEMSGYEQCRDKRIKENMERMNKLGIIDLSRKLKSDKKRFPRNPSERKTTQRSPLPSSTLPSPRRSSRLQNVTPVSYSELPVKKKKVEDMEPLVGKYWKKPEIYTEEHDKLLGTCDASWTLFVDGYGGDGRRVYDPIKGKTCHQCRQKTIGHRTHCSKCNLVQGQFCGDCLCMRYGENVLEANQNPCWICPGCRGICNCSLCRQAKGWPPTGSIYRKVSKLGFKSVAHYLIQTQRSEMKSEEDPGTGPPVSVKRLLPFADLEKLSKQNESLSSDGSQHGGPKPESEDKNGEDELKGEKEEYLSSDSKHGVSNVATESDPKNKTEPCLATEPSPDSIAGRLRQRRNNI